MPHGNELKHIQDRRNLPTDMTSRAISQTIPPKIRAQSFFSARVAESNILSRFREITDSYMTGRIGRDEARNLMLEYARDNNRDDGTRAITNLASSARLNLIIDQNASMAKAVGDYERMYSSVNKKLFPYVIYHASVGSRTPRSEHQRYDGMIFEKDDPWLKTHWPPWDFNCHCRLENCTDKKAHKTPDLIQPPTPADKITVDTKSGYSFDPAHAFEKFDYEAIKDPDLQDKAKSGVEQILAENSGVPASNPAGASGSAPPAGGSSGSGGPPKNKDDIMSMLLEPDQKQETGKYAFMEKPEEFLKENAEEMKRRVAEESSRKVFPKNPKEFLHGAKKKRAKLEARRAVPRSVMKEVSGAVQKMGKDAIKPFRHYSSRPGDSENVSVRQAAFKNGKLDWTGVEVSEERKRAVADLQNLLDVMPKFKGTVYRGCSFDSIDDAENYIRKIFEKPETLKGFISTTPDPVVARHYAAAGKIKVVVVVPNSQNGVYFGPYSTHPEDEEALISYKFYLKGLTKYEEDGIIYVLAEEVAR